MASNYSNRMNTSNLSAALIVAGIILFPASANAICRWQVDGTLMEEADQPYPASNVQVMVTARWSEGGLCPSGTCPWTPWLPISITDGAGQFRAQAPVLPLPAFVDPDCQLARDFRVMVRKDSSQSWAEAGGLQSVAGPTNMFGPRANVPTHSVKLDPILVKLSDPPKPDDKKPDSSVASAPSASGTMASAPFNPISPSGPPSGTIGNAPRGNGSMGSNLPRGTAGPAPRSPGPASPGGQNYAGSYRGIVKGRNTATAEVRVTVPAALGGDGLIWTNPPLSVGNRDQGTFYVPEIGDEVLVIFAPGEPQSPIWAAPGGVWNSGDTAPPGATTTTTTKPPGGGSPTSNLPTGTVQPGPPIGGGGNSGLPDTTNPNTQITASSQTPGANSGSSNAPQTAAAAHLNAYLEALHAEYPPRPDAAANMQGVMNEGTKITQQYFPANKGREMRSLIQSLTLFATLTPESWTFTSESESGNTTDIVVNLAIGNASMVKLGKSQTEVHYKLQRAGSDWRLLSVEPKQ